MFKSMTEESKFQKGNTFYPFNLVVRYQVSNLTYTVELSNSW